MAGMILSPAAEQKAGGGKSKKSGGWLGDCISDDERLYLRVVVAEVALPIDRTAARCSNEPIEADKRQDSLLNHKHRRTRIATGQRGLKRDEIRTATRIHSRTDGVVGGAGGINAVKPAIKDVATHCNVDGGGNVTWRTTEHLGVRSVVWRG